VPETVIGMGSKAWTLPNVNAMKGRITSDFNMLYSEDQVYFCINTRSVQSQKLPLWHDFI
jgi:hypothetical protein